jgi:hypothetical protein
LDSPVVIEVYTDVLIEVYTDLLFEHGLAAL